MLDHAYPWRRESQCGTRAKLYSSLCSLSPTWEHEFLLPSMAFNTASAFDTICRLDRNDTLVDVPQNNEQKSVTGLLLDKLHKQDFAGPLACRASKVSGPISRHRIADILPRMKIVSRASRPGLLVGFLCILCNGLCTARRFHTAVLDAQMSLTLSLITMSVPGCLTSFDFSGDMLRYCHREIFYVT